MKRDTSWDNVSDWYDSLMEESKNSYHKDLILPNFLRLLNIKKDEVVLDLACGQGFFSREFSKVGARVIGVDASLELISIARKHSNKETYYVSMADSLPFLADSSIDKIAIILSLQNIENINGIFKECDRVLKTKGMIYIVLNHPAFRIPKESAWGWDEIKKIQYRRIDAYLSESRVKIQIHPGSNPHEFTWSFHRPLQFYVKVFSKNNFCISKIEEWNSHKESEEGPKKHAEDRARREIPLFMFLEVQKIS